MSDEPEAKAGTFVCQGCGDTVEMHEPTEPWDCVVCGERMVHTTQNEVVPISELEALAERWRDRADTVEPHIGEHDDEIVNQRNEWNVGVWRAMANELEALIKEHSHD